MLSHRVLLRQVVEEVIREDFPECIEEFEIVFDEVAEEIDRQPEPDLDRPESVMGFDGQLMTGTVIAATGWIAATFLKAAIKDSVERDVIPRLGRAEKWLLARGADRKMVKQIRRRVEGVLGKIAKS